MEKWIFIVFFHSILWKLRTINERSFSLNNFFVQCKVGTCFQVSILAAISPNVRKLKISKKYLLSLRLFWLRLLQNTETLNKLCRPKYPLINKFNGFLSTVLARAISYIIQLVSNHECSIFSSLLSVLGVNPKGGFERYIERRREAILFEGMWRTCFSSYIRRKKETRTTGRRTRYALCKSVLSNCKTCIFVFRILYYIYTGDGILYKHKSVGPKVSGLTYKSRAK